VLRGGSWNNNTFNVRSGYRNNDESTNCDNNSGFRVAKALWLVSSFQARIRLFTDDRSEGEAADRLSPRP
jgi:hypothetical protein